MAGYKATSSTSLVLREFLMLRESYRRMLRTGKRPEELAIGRGVRFLYGLRRTMDRPIF